MLFIKKVMWINGNEIKGNLSAFNLLSLVKLGATTLL